MRRGEEQNRLLSNPLPRMQLSALATATVATPPWSCSPWDRGLVRGPLPLVGAGGSSLQTPTANSHRLPGHPGSVAVARPGVSPCGCHHQQQQQLRQVPGGGGRGGVFAGGFSPSCLPPMATKLGDSWPGVLFQPLALPRDPGGLQEGGEDALQTPPRLALPGLGAAGGGPGGAAP